MDLLVTTETEVGLVTAVDVEIVITEEDNEIQISSIALLTKTPCMALVIGVGLVIFHPNAQTAICPPFGEDNNHPQTIQIITQPPPLCLGFQTHVLAIMWHHT